MQNRRQWRPLRFGQVATLAIPAWLLDAVPGISAAAAIVTAIVIGRCGTTDGRALAWMLLLIGGVLPAFRWRLRGAAVASSASLAVFGVITVWSGTMAHPSIALLPAALLIGCLPLLAGRIVQQPLRDRAVLELAAQQQRQQAELEGAVQASEARFHSLLQNASDLIAVLDASGDFRYVSPSVERLLGYRPEQLSGASFFDGIHPDDAARMRELHFSLLATPVVSPTASFQYRDGSGEWHTLGASFSNQLQDPAVAGIVVNARDVTERFRHQERLEHLAFHDPLTGLPNRALFHDRLGQALSRAARTHEHVAVFYLDLDRFKQVNDTMGHAAGDALLNEVGRRVAACVRPGDTVARLGGDEFAILLADEPGLESAINVADRILNALSQPVRLAEGELRTSTSIGIALNRTDETLTDLVRRADDALYVAKAGGRGLYAVSDDGYADRAVVMPRLTPAT